MSSPRAHRQAVAAGRVVRSLRIGASATVRELRLERDRRAARQAQPAAQPARLPAGTDWRARTIEALVAAGIVALALVAMGAFEVIPSAWLIDVRLGSAALFFVAGGFLVLRARRVRPLLRARSRDSIRHAVHHWQARAFERLADIVGHAMLLAAALELALALVRVV